MDDFDAQVAALRDTATPKATHKKKADCTPEEWASHLLYYQSRYANDPNASRRVTEYTKKWRSANPERKRGHDRKRRAVKGDVVRASQLKWRQANPTAKIEHQRKWRANNIEQARASSLSWSRSNKERTRKLRADRRASDPTFKLQGNLRSRLKQAVKGNYKQGSAVRDLGCTIAEFWAHMESQFQPGMTRENMGKAWEIDHIYPLSKADLTGSRMEFLAANNWRNLQPLTPKQNLEKGDTITTEAQALFDQLCAEFAEKVAA